MAFDKIKTSNIIQSENKINHSLNFLKFIAIFAVVTIHCDLWKIGTKGVVIDALARFSVIIFFLISGFFSFYADDSKALNTYKRRLNKLVKILLIASVLYFAYMAYAQLPNLLSKLNLDALFNLIIFNVAPFGFHLWFILTLIYCYILYYILIKFQAKPNTLYKFIPILILFNLFIGEFLTSFICGFYAKGDISSSIKLSFVTAKYYRNFLFMGLPFFTLGYLIHDKKDILMENISNLFLIAFGIFSLLLTILEVLLVGKVDVYMGTIIFSACTFIWCIKNPDTLNFKITEFIGGKLYGLIYVLHLMIIWIINPQLGYLNPIVCFIPTTIICAMIYFILRKIGWKK